MSSMYGATGSGNRAPSGYNVGRLQNFSPEQMNLFKSLFSHVSPDSYLSKMAGGDQSFFEQQEAPAMRQFQGHIGDLASRFSAGAGKGSLGSRHSSSFQNATTQASSNFAQDLQSRRQQLQRQAIQDLLGLGGDLLNQKPYEQNLYENKPGFLQSILGDALGSFSRGAGSGLFGGGMSSMQQLFKLFGGGK